MSAQARNEREEAPLSSALHRFSFYSSLSTGHAWNGESEREWVKVDEAT